MIETNTEYDEFLRNRCPVEKKSNQQQKNISFKVTFWFLNWRSRFAATNINCPLRWSRVHLELWVLALWPVTWCLRLWAHCQLTLRPKWPGFSILLSGFPSIWRLTVCNLLPEGRACVQSSGSWQLCSMAAISGVYSSCEVLQWWLLSGSSPGWNPLGIACQSRSVQQI